MPDSICIEDDAGAALDAGAPALLDAALCSSSDGGCGCNVDAGSHVVAHWLLDETAGRLAANTRASESPGVLQGFDNEEPWLAGKLGGGLRFDGVDDRVSVGAIRGEVRTVALWLKPTSSAALRRQTPMQLPTAHGPLDEWAEPENAYLDDDKAATAASLIGTKAQHWGGFHLAQLLPAAAAIRGLTVTVDTGNLGVLGYFRVELSSDAGQTLTNLRPTWAQLIGGTNLRQAGGADNLWGRVWTMDELSDERFRVWGSFGGIANSMALNFLSVQVSYTPEHTVLALSADTELRLVGGEGKTVSTVGWPGSTVFINGRAGATLSDDWNHVVIVSYTGIVASDVRLGSTASGAPTSPYDGIMDDVVLLDVALTAEQVVTLSATPECGL